MNVEEEVGRLKEEIQRLGKIQPDGSYKVYEKPINFIFMVDLEKYILESCLGIFNNEIQPIFNNGTFLKVTFGVLFNDDKCANIFEALVGTLRAAKKRKVVAYEGELLLQGVHDNVEITLNPPPSAASIAST